MADHSQNAIAQSAPEHRLRTHGVSVAVMVQRDLDQSLQELLLRMGAARQTVLEHLVGVKEAGLVELLNP